MSEFPAGSWSVNPETPSVVMTPHGRIGINWSSNLDPNIGETAEKAAQLIAVAPDLLAALARLVELKDATPVGYQILKLAAWQDARNVLAKAIGAKS